MGFAAQLMPGGVSMHTERAEDWAAKVYYWYVKAEQAEGQRR